MWANPQFYTNMFTFTKEIPNWIVHSLCIDFCKQIKKNYCEEENNLFLVSLFTFFEKRLPHFLPLGV